jgi:hypothetical protein
MASEAVKLRLPLCVPAATLQKMMDSMVFTFLSI